LDVGGRIAIDFRQHTIRLLPKYKAFASSLENTFLHNPMKQSRCSKNHNKIEGGWLSLAALGSSSHFSLGDVLDQL
jgi:hypothetical protein